MTEETYTPREITIKHNNPEDVILKYYIAELEIVAADKGDTLTIIDDPRFYQHILVEVTESEELIDSFGIPYFKDLPKEAQDKFLEDAPEDSSLSAYPEDISDEV